MVVGGFDALTLLSPPNFTSIHALHPPRFVFFVFVLCSPFITIPSSIPSSINHCHRKDQKKKLTPTPRTNTKEKESSFHPCVLSLGIHTNEKSKNETTKNVLHSPLWERTIEAEEGGWGIERWERKIPIRRPQGDNTLRVGRGLLECPTDGQDCGGGQVEEGNVLENGSVVLRSEVGEPPVAFVCVDLV